MFAIFHASGKITALNLPDFAREKIMSHGKKQILQFIVDTAFAGIYEDWERQANGGFMFLLSEGSGVQIASGT